MAVVRPRDILDFWFAAGKEKWWSKSDAFDAEIRKLFGDSYHAGVAGKLDDWINEPQGALALILLLDQFSRNLYRNDHRAWEQDGKALAVAREAIARRFDVEIPLTARNWVYMPFMHSEDMAVQEESLGYFGRLGDPEIMKFAEEHADIIRRFGRFPHRNEVLGRVSSEAERDFLASGGFKG
jgi:uncharacterized protein (DUF924 family)|tara:strand:- start:62504 stop:63049 length:546 start_codon:yes stop_codon:yes gene_type:complete